MEKGLSKPERSQKIIDEECDGKQTVLADRLGKSQQNMNALLKKGAWYDACALHDAFPNINLEWLITGTGPMYKPGMEPKKERRAARCNSQNGTKGKNKRKERERTKQIQQQSKTLKNERTENAI